MKNKIRRAEIFLLVLIIFLSVLPSCTQHSESESTTDDSSSAEALHTDAPTEPVTDAVTEEPKSYITLNSSNFSKVRLVRSNDIGKYSTDMELFSAFIKQMNSRLSTTFSFTSDIVAQNNSGDGILILVGNTEIALSVELKARLDSLGTNAYGIIARDNVIAIAATDTYFLYEALDHFMVNFISKDDSGNLQLKIEDGLEYIADKDVDYPDPEEIINSGKEYAFFSIDKLTDVPTKGNFSVMQGGGSDGKYAYYAMINKSTTPETAMIYKYDMATWELVASSKSIPSAHTNDITYDSKNHRLVISYCSSTDGWKGLVFVNPDTLEFIEYIVAPTVSRGVTYLPEKNQYVFAANYTFCLTDENFNTISSFVCGYPQLTTQGFYCDGKYIYDPRWKSGAKYQTITIDTIDGNFIGAIELHGIDGEPENIFRDGNSFVMGCNKSDAVFRLALAYKTWWD